MLLSAPVTQGEISFAAEIVRYLAVFGPTAEALVSRRTSCLPLILEGPFGSRGADSQSFLVPASTKGGGEQPGRSAAAPFVSQQTNGGSCVRRLFARPMSPVIRLMKTGHGRVSELLNIEV